MAVQVMTMPATQQSEKDKALVDAVMRWANECEGQPRAPCDAELLKALMTYEGDRPKMCPACDGDCEEDCRAITVDEMHAAMDGFIENWKNQQGHD